MQNAELVAKSEDLNLKCGAVAPLTSILGRPGFLSVVCGRFGFVPRRPSGFLACRSRLDLVDTVGYWHDATNGLRSLPML
jgi:hypothetical protein